MTHSQELGLVVAALLILGWWVEKMVDLYWPEARHDG